MALHTPDFDWVRPVPGPGGHPSAQWPPKERGTVHYERVSTIVNTQSYLRRGSGKLPALESTNLRLEGPELPTTDGNFS